MTCLFLDSQAQYTANVAITLTDSDTLQTATASMSVEVVPDLFPPVLSLPAAISVPATSQAGAIVSYIVSANDAVSGDAAVSCTPNSGTQFPIGSTTVSCTASDWKGNPANGSFSVVVNDETIPTLTLPAPMTLDATGPSGAVAIFTATAIDWAPANPAVLCQPASGSTFAAGTTAVVCQATDTAGNKAVGQFNVTVRGATQQLASLSAQIQAMAIDAKSKEKLLKLLSGVASTLPKSRPGACGQLSEFLAVATDAARKGQLTAQQLNEIVVEVNRIKAVVGC